MLTGICGNSQSGAVVSVSCISDNSTPQRKGAIAVINTIEVMLVLEAIVTCRWSLVALTYALPETMWLRVESAYIFFHKYPIAESSVIRWMGTMFIIHNSKGFPLLWLIKCYDWCDLMPCCRIVYELESIQLDMDWWHACIITQVSVFYQSGLRWTRTCPM